MMNLPTLLRRTAAAVLMGAAACAAATAQSLPTDLQEDLQAALDSVYQSNPSWKAGISASVIGTDGSSWQGVTGYATTMDGVTTPLTTDHRFRMYSSTKSFTAALILQLRDEGLLSLDDTLGQFVDVSAMPNLTDRVTVRDLLMHRSGFQDYVDNISFQIQVAVNPDSIWAPEDIITHAGTPYFPYGQDQHEYSSTNYILLGLIAKALLPGTTVEQQFRERFFTPHNLNEVYFPYAETVEGTLAAPHDNLFEFDAFLPGTQPDSLIQIDAMLPMEGVVSAAWTTGALVSTAENLGRWGRAYYGGAVLGPMTTDEMLASVPPEEDDDYAGYGIYNDAATAQGWVGHGGASIGYRSKVGHHPALNMSFGVMINQGSGSLDNVSRALINQMYEYYNITSVEDGLGLGATHGPNPASDLWGLHVDGNVPVRADWFDGAGRLVRTASGVSDLSVSVTDLPAGVYAVRLTARNRVESLRVVVR